MVKRCVVGNCSNSNLTGHSVHHFPRDPIYRQKWERFVRTGRAEWNHATAVSVICGEHFVAPDDFEGYMQWKMGYKRKLDVKKSAVPSKNTKQAPISTPSRTQLRTILPSPAVPSSSQHCDAKFGQEICWFEEGLNHGLETLPAKTTVGDTEHHKLNSINSQHPNTPKRVPNRRRKVPIIPCSVATRKNTKATQCCIKVHKRTKQLQVSPKIASVGIQCSLLADTDQAVPHTTEIIRGQEKKNTSDSESAKSAAYHSDYVVSYACTAENTTTICVSPSQRQQGTNTYMQPPPDQEEKYIVRESSPLDLLKVCSVCRAETTGAVYKRLGTLVHVQQHCSSCGYTREWSSQTYEDTMSSGNTLEDPQTIRRIDPSVVVKQEV